MKSAGRVSIAILTYRRPAYLERAIVSAQSQRGNIDEILVVDNAADEELRSWLNLRFPSVRYLPMSYNGGCDGRNLALREARAPIVITIDDDVELVGEDCANAVIEAFEQDSSLACLNFKILRPDGRLCDRDWCHPRPIEDASRGFETYFILEGECALRREAALNVGGYSPAFFLYHEGLDLAYRLISQGYRIQYTPDIAVLHHIAPDATRASRFYYCSVRNGIWIAYQYLPPASAIVSAVGHTAKMTFFAVRARQLQAHVRGCVAALRGIPTLTRQPLSRTALARMKAIRAERPALLTRVRRHLRQRIM
jgi:GT2 family glycosyltransferase